MNINALFLTSMIMSFVAWGTVARLLIWPCLQTAKREDALIALVLPHAFRFIGLSFLIPGVVSPLLSPAFSTPAAYGDLVSAMLAIVVIWAIAARLRLAVSLLWIFNIFGTYDLLHAFYLGKIAINIDPGSLGAAYFLPTVIVPALVVSHGLIFWILVNYKKSRALA